MTMNFALLFTFHLELLVNGKIVILWLFKGWLKLELFKTKTNNYIYFFVNCDGWLPLRLLVLDDIQPLTTKLIYIGLLDTMDWLDKGVNVLIKFISN